MLYSKLNYIMSTPPNTPTYRPERPRRRMDRVVLTAALSAFAIAAGGAGLKVKRETDAYNNRVNAAQVTNRSRENVAEKSSEALSSATYNAKVGMFQQTLDNLEVKKLPAVIKDGKRIGYEPALIGFGLPASISDEQRTKIKELGVPITDEQVEKWEKDGYGKIDPDNFVKPDYDYYTNSNGIQIEYLSDQKLDKYKALCSELDAANDAALPYYRHVAQHDQTAAHEAQQHLQEEVIHKSDWVVFQ